MSVLGYIFMFADICRSLKSLQALNFPETGVAGVCELPETGAQNCSQVYALNHPVIYPILLYLPM